MFQLDVVKSFTSDAKITALTEHFITQENMVTNVDSCAWIEATSVDVTGTS